MPPPVLHALLYAFESRTADKKSKEQEKLNKFYNPADHKRKLSEAKRDLDKHQGMFSKVTGKTKALKQDVDALRRNLESLEQTREQTMRLFTSKASQDRDRLKERHQSELSKFDKQPIQKTGTAKSFEKTVLKKSVANQNTLQSKTPTAQKDTSQSEFKKAVLSHESQKEATANDNTKEPKQARTRNRSKERTKRKERTRSKGIEP